MSDLIISCTEGGCLLGLVAQVSERDEELMMIDWFARPRLIQCLF